MIKRSNVIIYMVSTSRELYHAGSVVNMASISAEHFQRPPEDLYSDQEAPGPLGTHRDLTMRSSVVIGLLRGQASLKRKIILNHLAKNIRDASSKYSLKPDHLPGVLQISVHHRHHLMALDGAATP